MPPEEIEAGATKTIDQVAAARASLHDSGVVIIRKSFDWRRIYALLQNAKNHAEFIARSVEAGTPRDFPPSYRWVDRSFACDIGALDPSTCEDESHDFNKTTLCAAVMTDLTQALLRSEIGNNAGYAVVRTRTILPRPDSNGSLARHKEKTAVGFPGVHVVWTPFTPPEIVTNVDAPGIEFRIVNREPFRPELRAGDVAIFTGEVEHGTHIPAAAAHWRVGCDIRVFPWTIENPLPEDAIAIGYGPQPLHWPQLESADLPSE